MLRCVFIVKCGIVRFLCAMGIILIPEATFVQNFISVTASIAELAHEEKSRTQSITQSPSIFNAPGTEALASKKWGFITQLLFHHLTVKCNLAYYSITSM